MAKPRLTKAGAILLAKAIAGTQLTFTRGAFGDAKNHDAPSDKQIDNFTALLHEKMSLPITGFKVEGNQAVITTLVKNEEITAGFRVVEGGIFARDTESNSDVLYAYFYDGDEADYMPAGNADFQLEYEYEFITAVSNAENVTAIIQRIYQGLTQEDLDAHINSTAPHPNWDVVLTNTFNTHVNSTDPHPNLDYVNHTELSAHSLSNNPHPNLEYVKPAELSAHSLSNNPHPNWEVIKAGVGLSKSNNTLNVTPATEKKLGGIMVGKNLYMSGESLNAEAPEVDVESRIKQLEINQANLYILLESVHKLGVQGNLIMTDDFQTLQDTRLAEADATISSKGFNFLTDNISFLRPSSAAVFSDGLLLNQPFAVENVARRDDGLYQLRSDTKFNETTSRGKVYRSSVTIKDDKAFGAGLVKTSKQTANKIWNGEGIAETAQVAFNAYPSLESSFALDGDWSLSADGYFTLD